MTTSKEDIILSQLIRLEGKVDLCIVDIAGLKVKSGIWGAIAGVIPGTIGIIMWVLSTQ